MKLRTSIFSLVALLLTLLCAGNSVFAKDVTILNVSYDRRGIIPGM
jgi:hypothetical protein